jgi:hypothetical protein
MEELDVVVDDDDDDEEEEEEEEVPSFPLGKDIVSDGTGRAENVIESVADACKDTGKDLYK